MSYRNGFLPDSALAPIPGSGPYGQPRLRKDAAQAYNALNRASLKKFGVSMALHESQVGRAYRSYNRQVLAKRTYGSNAATPGTSNHGLGINVDLQNKRQRYVIDQIGASYGFSKRWSDAQWEWWHITFKPGIYKPPARDPLWFLTADERRWVKEWKTLKRQNRNLARRRVLYRTLVQRRQAIWRAGEKNGWNKLHRRARYRYLLQLTGGNN